MLPETIAPMPARMKATRLWDRVCPALLMVVARLSSQAGADSDPLMELSPWQQFYNIRESAGYDDNVLLSPLRLGGSGFNRSEIEGTWVRLPLDGTQLSVFLQGEDTRYWSPGLVDKQQTFLGLVNLKRDFSDLWQAGCTAQYLHHDQVFDVSSTELNVTTVQAQANIFTLRPSLRRNFTHDQHVELELEGSRNEFIAPLDDYWEGGPKLTVGRAYGTGSELALSTQLHLRTYDSRPQVSEFGALLGGTSLQILSSESELMWRQQWDEARRWRTTLKLTAAREMDNGGSYFDAWRWQAGGQLDYRGEKWRIQTRVKASYIDFTLQRAIPALMATRNRLGVTASLRAERKLGKHWKLFGEYAHELARSNRPLDGYHGNVVHAGLDWEY